MLKPMKKIYLLPNIITAFGLTCGLFVIFKINMTGVGEVTPQLLLFITGMLILAAFADLLDGAIARVMKAESEFGTLFDSLADAVTFGVAPSIVILKTLSIEPGTEFSYLPTVAETIWKVATLMRSAFRLGKRQRLIMKYPKKMSAKNKMSARVIGENSQISG